MKRDQRKRRIGTVLTALVCVALLGGCSMWEESTSTFLSYYEAEEDTPTTTTAEPSAPDSSDEDPDAPTTTRRKTTTTKKKTTTTTAKKTTAPVTPAADKPSVADTARLLNPMTSPCDAEADALRKSIREAKDSLPAGSGRTWYVSNKGDNDNDGLSADTPKRSYNFGLQLREGDTVLFERGSVFHGMMISAASGVSYGAYGTGDKPCLYGSKSNAAAKKWRKYAGNIWESPETYTADVGIVVFNHGEHAGAKETSLGNLKDQYDFVFTQGHVYIYNEKEPSSEYTSIEIGYNHPLIQVATGVHDVHIDNLCLKYTGGHGISCLDKTSNIFITNCEIGWIGGSYLTGYGDGTARFGNGVEFWESCDNVKVENCWLYQIYDSALSHQGKQQDTVVNNLTFRNNLVEYTSYNAIEYWSSGIMQHILYEGNILRFSGFGWGEINRPNRQACTLATAGARNECVDFTIRRNIFDTAGVSLFNVGSGAGTTPTLDSNTYVQSTKAYLGAYNTKRYTFDSGAADTIRNVFGDPNPTVKFID